mmetsp:Transcript_30899/g.56050  ORF Transcript_30899/g.56050 Transcript_30899/m.56050 type:complete len:96 (-) Transcript_30899:49-336(-)
MWLEMSQDSLKSPETPRSPELPKVLTPRTPDTSHDDILLKLFGPTGVPPAPRVQVQCVRSDVNLFEQCQQMWLEMSQEFTMKPPAPQVQFVSATR